MSIKTIVLVHGAFAESASWNGVVRLLKVQGYQVVAAALPLRGVQSDAQAVASLLQSIDGPLVLVGHSYGGAVITNAATGNPNVEALVYVAGFAPDSGESAADLSRRYPGSTLGPTLHAVVLIAGGTDLYIRQEQFQAQFAADVPAEQAYLMAATQRPVAEAALNEASGMPAWKSIPSWFVFGALDKNIPAAAHRFMARRAQAQVVVEIEGASHAVAVSYPDRVAELIVEAARHTST